MVMRFFYIIRLQLLVFFLSALPTHIAYAFFNDDEARAEIKKLSLDFYNYKAVESQSQQLQKQKIDNIQSLQQAQQTQFLEISSKLDTLSNAHRALIGSLELIQKRLDDQESAINALNSLNLLKSRLDELEKNAQNSSQEIELEGQKIKADKDEIKLYRFGFEQFKTSDFGSAANALKTFIALYPESSLLPNAYYWLGNSYYALNDCKNSIRAHTFIFDRFSKSPQASDALLNSATCHKELNDSMMSKQVLNVLIEKYPNSNAAKTAESRLKNM